MTDSNGVQAYMPVGPANFGGYGDGMFGSNGAWWIIILLAVLGWGNGFGGMGNNGNGYLAADVQRGFDQSALTNGISGLQSAVNNGFAQAEIAANSRQMADMNQNFALQSAMQNCCCENRAATADLKYTIATEACANRSASAANTQAIMDKLCQLELDGIRNQLSDANNTINQLRTQLLVAQGQASQSAQTAAIIANNEAQTAALERYLAPTPIPAYMVQNPNCCSQNYGCGCGAA